METKLTNVRLKRNESFHIREGWLRKGMKLLPDYPDLFSRADAVARRREQNGKIYQVLAFDNGINKRKKSKIKNGVVHYGRIW